MKYSLGNRSKEEKEKISLLSLVFLGILISGSVAGVYGLVTYVLTVNNHAFVNPPNLTLVLKEGLNTISTIEWGSVDPLSTQTKILNVYNAGNSPLTLGLDTTGITGFIVSWDYDLLSIDPGNSLPIEFGLWVNSGIQGDKSFVFKIIATSL